MHRQAVSDLSEMLNALSEIKSNQNAWTEKTRRNENAMQWREMCGTKYW